jgi:hypothetical protein
MTPQRWSILILVGAALAGGAFWYWRYQPPAPPVPSLADPWFLDVTKQVGLDFVRDSGPDGSYFMPRQVGSGAAFFDFDNDGLLDILLLQNGGPLSASTNKLFRQRRDGTFEDVSKGSGLDINGHNMGVAIGDVNNDGWPDVLITQYNGVKLFLNQGGGKFIDVTVESGVSNPSWGTSAAFVDYDRDGWLDLVIVCYVDYDPTRYCDGSGKLDFCAPNNFKGRVSRLFHNLGGAGSNSGARVGFADVSVASGIGLLPGPGLGVVCADFDGDGWPDILVANDGAANFLWINQKNGTFKEEAVQRGIGYDVDGNPQANMGIAVGDVDGDGLVDVLTTHLAIETHTLWCQGPRGLYRDRTQFSGILKSQWRGTGFGTLFGDFNNDGNLDLAIVNGAVAAQSTPGDDALGPFWKAYGQRNQLFAGDGKGRFQDISVANKAFCGKMNVARGLVCGDVDRDGGLDLLVTTCDGPARLYRNVAARGGWLSVRAFDPLRKRDAIGAEIRVHAAGKSWVRWLHPAESYLSSSEPRVHFGLGDVASIERIEVRWPEGTHERFPGCDTNKRIELHRGKGTPLDP